MDDLDQPTPREEPEPPDLSPAPPPPAPRSSPALDQIAREVERTQALFEQNMRLAVQRNEQLARMLESEREDLHQVMSEMVDTLRLQQEMLGQQDTVIQNLGKATAALIHLRADFQAQVEEIRAAQRHQ